MCDLIKAKASPVPDLVLTAARLSARALAAWARNVARDTDKSVPPIIRACLLLSLKVVFKINPPVLVCLASLGDVTNQWQLN